MPFRVGVIGTFASPNLPARQGISLSRHALDHKPIGGFRLRAGRIEILGTPRSLEWVTPVLYLRGDNARLFDFRSPDLSNKRRENDLRERYKRARDFEGANRFVNAIREYDEILRLDPTYRDSAGRREALEEALRLTGEPHRDEPTGSDANVQNDAATLGGPSAHTDAARVPQVAASQRDFMNVPAPEEMLQLSLDDNYAGRLHGFSADGNYFAISTPAGARLIDIRQGEEISRIPRRSYLSTLDFAFSPDGSRFATAVSDNIAVLWHTKNGEEIARLRLKANVRAFTFSPDGALLAAATGSYGGSATAHAYLWDTSNGHQVARLRHRGTVYQAIFSPDGKRLATASHDKTAALWDVSTLGQVARLQHQGTVFSVEFSSDGSRLATSTSFTNRLWDAANHLELLRVTVKRGWHNSTLSPDSKRLVNLSEHEAGRLSDMSDGGLIMRLSHRGAHRTVFCQDGSRFVTTGGGRSLIWDSATGHEVRRLDHEARLLEAATPGTWVAAHSDDGTLSLWNEADGREVGQLRHDGSATLLGVAPDESCVAVEEMIDGKVRLRLWQVTSDGAQT
jgi:WD40 repeat protein